jgi:predicted dienelactone hydrolase
MSLLLVIMQSWSTQAQQDQALAYASRGSHTVGIVDFTITEGNYALYATLWYPALNPDDAAETYTYNLNGLVTEGQAISDALPDTANAPYPLIIYSHGLFGARLESTHYLEHLASWGFVVMAADHVGSTFFDTTSAQDVVRSFGYRPQDVTRLIDYAETINSKGSFAGLVNMNAVGVTGFSFGGYTTLLAGGALLDSRAVAATCESLSSAENALCDAANLQLLAEIVGLGNVPDTLWQPIADDRITAVLPLAPCCVDLLGTNGIAGITIPIMVIAGTADEVAPPERHGMLAFNHTNNESRALVLIEDAGHDVYLDIYTGEITRAHDLIQHFATAFFKANLLDDADAAALLDPAKVRFDEITYAISTIGTE